MGGGGALALRHATGAKCIVSDTLILLAADFTVVSKCREVKPIKQKTECSSSSVTVVGK